MKTLAAEVVANQAGADLYRADLSRVVSKFVGEAEKNRSDANIDVRYLLQPFEE